MTTKKPMPRTRPSPITAHIAFATVLLRADVMEEVSLWSTGEEETEAEPFDAVLSLIRVEPNEHRRITALCEIFYASTYVVIEAWRRYKFSDFEVDRMLRNTENTRLLLECRDRIFHPATHDDSIELFDRNSREGAEIDQWIDKLLDAMSRYTRNWFAENLQTSGSPQMREAFLAYRAFRESQDES